MINQSYRPMDFEQCVQTYEATLFRIALAMTGNHLEAEDIIQEVFIKMLKKTPQFESATHEKAWLIRVTINQGNSLLRALKRKKTEPLLDIYPAKTPEQYELISELMKLPKQYRTVMHLFYYEGYSTKEIAELTNINEATIRSQLSRARQQLKNLLEEDYDESL